MEKIAMRDWVAGLEYALDKKLSKWVKHNKIENGESVQLRWQFEQAHMHIDLFWHDGKESVRLLCVTPRQDHDFRWAGLDDRTFNKVMDRVGNIAQVVMHPPIDPTDG